MYARQRNLCENKFTISTSNKKYFMADDPIYQLKPYQVSRIPQHHDDEKTKDKKVSK